jgi:hypothetical protein
VLRAYRVTVKEPNCLQQGRPTFFWQFHSRHCGLVPSYKAKNHKSCVNFYTKVKHVLTETAHNGNLSSAERFALPQLSCLNDSHFKHLYRREPSCNGKIVVVLLFRCTQLLLYVRNLKMWPRVTVWIPMVNRKKTAQPQCNVQLSNGHQYNQYNAYKNTRPCTF